MTDNKEIDLADVQCKWEKCMMLLMRKKRVTKRQGDGEYSRRQTEVLLSLLHRMQLYLQKGQKEKRISGSKDEGLILPCLRN